MNREPNFTPREEQEGPYLVRYRRKGFAYMNTGREPAMTAFIYRDSRLITHVSLNSATLCQDGYSVRGVEATTIEILHATLGDEHIYTGTSSFPHEHDEALLLRNEEG